MTTKEAIYIIETILKQLEKHGENYEWQEAFEIALHYMRKGLDNENK